MRNILHDETVLYRARLTLIGVADDVLLPAGCVSDDVPLCARGKTCAAHSPQTADLKHFQNSLEVAPFYKPTHGLVRARAAIRVSRQTLTMLMVAMRAR